MFIEITRRLSQDPEERHMADVAPPDLGELLGAVFYKHYAPLALQNLGIRQQYQAREPSWRTLPTVRKAQRSFLNIMTSSCMHSVAEKVTAFVTRLSPHGPEILLFEHPSAGIQLPAGTVEADEPHADAAAREAREETGLVDLPVGRFLATVTEPLPDQRYLVTTTTRVYARPDTTSVDWASIRRGMPVMCNRQGPDFCHVTYVECNEVAEPSYVSYQITGWVPTTALTRQVTRYFYHFPYHGEAPDTWWVDTDNHRFRLFWAPLAQLPPIIEPQRWWLNILLQSQTSGGDSA